MLGLKSLLLLTVSVLLGVLAIYLLFFLKNLKVWATDRFSSVFDGNLGLQMLIPFLVILVVFLFSLRSVLKSSEEYKFFDWAQLGSASIALVAVIYLYFVG